MEYGVRSREAHSGSGGVSGPGFPVAGSWLESMALAAYGNPLGYHPNQMPPSAALFLSSLQHSLQSSYENAALELVHKPKKREPPDDDVDKDEDKDKEDEKDKEHSQEMKQGDEEEQEEEKDGHEEDRGDADEVENEASAESWDAQMAALNSWMLNNYTTMMGRLSAFRAAYEAGSNFASDSESESDHSSTSHSRDSSPDNSLHPTYVVVSDKAMMSATSASRSKKRKRLSKPRSANNKESASSESGSTTSQGKKRSLALQRVRYEREEYRCSLCSYACTIEKAFLRHLRAHARGTASESQVSCAVCGADRSSEVDLSKHMRRHRDNRFFCCDICIFRTVQLKKLIQHRRMHTGEKPHLCPHCDYRSARRDNLRSHVRRVHKKENLYCDTFSPRGMFIAPKLQPPSPSPVEDATEDVHEEDRGSPASAPAPSSPAPPDEAPPEQESCDVG